MAAAPRSTQRPDPPSSRYGSTARHRLRRRPSAPARRRPEPDTARYAASPEGCSWSRADQVLDKPDPRRSGQCQLLSEMAGQGLFLGHGEGVVDAAARPEVVGLLGREGVLGWALDP